MAGSGGPSRLAPQLLLLLPVLLAAVFLQPCAACSSSISKRPARPAAPAPSSPAPQQTPPQTQRPSQPPQRTNMTFPTYKCPEPFSEYYCLNDAECFTILIQDNPLYNCECKDGFVGQRCEYKDLDGSYLLSRGRLMLETASIAGGAGVALLLACVLALGLWARARRRPKRLDACVEEPALPPHQ